MTRGLDVSATGAVGGSPEAPPDDTGEAMGLAGERPDDHVRLRPDTVRDRRRRPLRHRGAAPCRARAAARLPRRRPRSRCVRRRPVHPGVRRRPAGRRARDPQPQPHRLRARAAALVAAGFGRTSRTTSAQQTPRNLFGFKDGTAQHPRRRHAALEEHVWVAASDDPAWMAGGSYLVARKIAMLIETWDRVRLVGAERRSSGATRARARRCRAATSSPSPDFDADGCRGRAGHARRQSRAPRASRRSTAASGSCAAATTSSTATTTSAGSTPGCSSCRTSARPSSSCGCSGRCRPTS